MFFDFFLLICCYREVVDAIFLYMCLIHTKWYFKIKHINININKISPSVKKFDQGQTIKRCTFDKFVIIRKGYCIMKYCVIKYFWLSEEVSTINNFIFKIFIFTSNGNDWARGKTLIDSTLKLSRHDLQIFAGGSSHSHYGILIVSKHDLGMLLGLFRFLSRNIEKLEAWSINTCRCFFVDFMEYWNSLGVIQ